ncbi:MAG: disulfide bond formation protein B [Candidatus Pacebacteria bacterium]|nr:disulfide bond formation protein B [Candidatus Paceibacterota bacterium]MBP9852299.1 disulfide bond formation protein B [Candidatus Paceibacterota bacterium]
MKTFLRQNALYIAWALALVAMLGSLYFSEIKGFAPCVLCWYQRIAIYPLVLLIPVGIIKKDPRIADYVLTLSIAGLIVSLYQNLLYYKILPESVSPCSTGVSCLTKYVEYFGFLTIPLLSFITLAAITTLMIMYKKQNHA